MLIETRDLRACCKPNTATTRGCFGPPLAMNLGPADASWCDRLLPVGYDPMVSPIGVVSLRAGGVPLSHRPGMTAANVTTHTTAIRCACPSSHPVVVTK